MEGDSPCVSVIIPAYQVAPWIGETVASVLAQTRPDWEAIVVNDGSPDTEALEQALAPFRHQITYLVQPNQGAAAARNTAIARARGEWLAFLDGDDRWEPRFLEDQLAFIATNRLDMAWSDGWIVGDTPNAGRRIMELRPCHGEVAVEALLRQTVSVGTSATIVRRTKVVEVGGFDVTQRRAQDFDLWVRLVHAGVRAGYNRQPLIHYRVREGNLSGNALSQAERALAVLTHIGDTVRLGDADRSVLQARIGQLEAGRLTLLGKTALLAGDYPAATRAFRDAHALAPSAKLRTILALLAVAPALVRRLYRARGPEGVR